MSQNIEHSESVPNSQDRRASGDNGDHCQKEAYISDDDTQISTSCSQQNISSVKDVTESSVPIEIRDRHSSEASQLSSGINENEQIDDNINDMNECVENTSNLIVNYLPPDMTQDEVFALFNSIGEVESCNLVRDKTTKASLGYAFVKFVQSEDAKKSIKMLNKLRLQNKTIKVSVARPSSESIKGANLYVAGLPKKMNQSELECLFSKYGKIITARILSDNKTGLSRGIAFIRYDRREEAELTIQNLNNIYLEGCMEPIVVKFANSPIRNNYQKNVCVSILQQMVNPLSFQNTSIDMMDLSSVSNHAVTCNIARIISPLQHLATMSQIHCITAGTNQFLDTLPTTNNYPAPVASPTPGALTSSGWCIFIYNMTPETCEPILWQLFCPFGAVQSVKIIRDINTNKCKGFGFVTMSNYEEALLAIESLNGFALGNRILQVSFKTSPKFKTDFSMDMTSSSN